MKPEEKPATTLRPLGLTANERTSPGFSPPPSRNSCCKPGFLQSTKRRVESELAMVMLVCGAGMTATAVRAPGCLKDPLCEGSFL